MANNTFYEFILPENPLAGRLQRHRLKNEFTDLTIKVGHVEFRAHRLVLADVSPVMKAMLSKEWSKGDALRVQRRVRRLEHHGRSAGLFLLWKNRPDNRQCSFDLFCRPLLTPSGTSSACEQLLSKNICSVNVFDLFFFSDKLNSNLFAKAALRIYRPTTRRRSRIPKYWVSSQKN